MKVLSKFKNLVVLVFVVALLNCGGKKTQFEVCDHQLPAAVVSCFSQSYETHCMLDLGNSAITDKTHWDLYMTELGIVNSKKYGWKVDIKYRPRLLYENETCYLIDTGTHVDKIRFKKLMYWWYVIRKKDGKIIRMIKQDDTFLRAIAYKDILYFRRSKNDLNVYCILIGED